MRWIVLFVAIFLAADDWSSGENFGLDTLNHFKNNFTANIANPLMADKEFKTVDENRKFRANLSCNGTTVSYVEISYVGDSDIDITIKIDSNLDGTKDKFFTFGQISGVCADGVVKCDKDSWNNCKFYKWQYNGNYYLTDASRYDVGKCYCINSSCQNLAKNKKFVHEIIGGAISTLISNFTSNIITKVENTEEKIEFFGQNLGNCKNYEEKGYSGGYSERDDTYLASKSDELKSSELYLSVDSGAKNYNANKEQFDFTKLKQRQKEIYDSAQNSGTDFSYKDFGKNQNGSLNIKFDTKRAKYCYVKILEKENEVFSDSTIKENDMTYKYEYRECVENWTQCPIYNENESIKYDCGNISNFSEVASAMSALEEVSKDIVCSTN